MALTNSPRIITDGLVYCHDSNNKKSYAGPPIQNLAKSITTYPQLATGISVTGGTEVVNIPQLGSSQTYYAYVQNNYTSYTPNSAACCIQLIGGWGGFAVSPSTTYTYGIVYKCDSGYTSPNYMYRYEYTANGGTFVTEGGIHNNSNRVHLGEGWYWAWGTFTTQATTNWISNAALYYYQYSPFVDKVSVAKVLITQGNYTTMHPQYWPAQNVTRANTQVLSDLTNKSSITANSLTYANDGTFSFNGTSDYIDIGSISSLLGSEITVSTISKISSVVSKNALFSINGVYSFFLPGNRLTTTNQLYWDSVSGWKSGATTSWNINQWYYLSWTILGTTLRFYINGVADGTATLAGNMAPTGSSRIGLANGGEYATGSIPYVQIYNRALTVDEIKQNYNALRGRYSL